MFQITNKIRVNKCVKVFEFRNFPLGRILLTNLANLYFFIQVSLFLDSYQKYKMKKFHV